MLHFVAYVNFLTSDVPFYYIFGLTQMEGHLCWRDINSIQSIRVFDGTTPVDLFSWHPV